MEREGDGRLRTTVSLATSHCSGHYESLPASAGRGFRRSTRCAPVATRGLLHALMRLFTAYACDAPGRLPPSGDLREAEAWLAEEHLAARAPSARQPACATASLRRHSHPARICRTDWRVRQSPAGWARCGPRRVRNAQAGTRPSTDHVGSSAGARAAIDRSLGGTAVAHPFAPGLTISCMFPELPLDDVIGQTFYVDGALWRVAYNRTARRIALRRIAPEIPFARAVDLIASGELLWNPPDPFEPLEPETSVESVQRQIALLDAFRRSPACTASTDWSLRTRVEARLFECRSWLARRALPSGDSAREADGGSD